jgi:tRNA threonylcarbamoyladenosine biosynthesis protein TsaB
VILAFETATQSVGVALADVTSDGSHNLIASLEILQGRKHAETLIPAAEQLFAHIDSSYRDLTAVAVDIGPGLFTGLRVGVATAKAVALACDIPVLCGSSLELLALAAADDPRGVRGDVLCVIDARRKELYGQVFRIGNGTSVSIGEAFVAPAADVRAQAEKQCEEMQCALTVVIGSGAAGYLDVFNGLEIVAGLPSARTLALHASSFTSSHADTVELLYLRPPDAEINWVSR